MAITNNYPDLSEAYDLDGSQIEAFQTKGHILLRGVASDQEVQAYRELITQSTTEFAKSYKPLSQRIVPNSFVRYPKIGLLNERFAIRISFLKRFVRLGKFRR